MKNISIEEERNIIKLWHEGKSIAKISNEVKRDRNAVHRALKRNGLHRTNRRFTPEQEVEIITKYQLGLSLNELAAFYNCADIKTFANVLKRHRIKARNRGGTPLKIEKSVQEKAMELWDNGDSVVKIAQQLGLSYVSLKQWFKKEGIDIAKNRAVGEKHGMWRGGKRHLGGYALVRLQTDDPYYSMTLSNGYVLEHRYVMARYLERTLRSDETVHHINGDRTDNRLENLQLRIGCHGKHQAYCCARCGSTDLKPMELD